MEVCHNDGNEVNDRLENLRWDTHLENMRDLLRHGTHANTNKTHCLRGHLLAAPNLARVNQTRKVERACLACHRARCANDRARWSGRPVADMQILSDAKYAQIMAAVSDAAA
jgi:hypothetical protein